MTYSRVFLAVCSLWLVMLVGAAVGHAQTEAKPAAQMQAAPQEQQTSETKPLEVKSPETKPEQPSPEITNNNKAYQAALAARKSADKAIRDALDSGDSEAFDQAVTAREAANTALVDAAVSKDASAQNNLGVSGAEQNMPKKKSLIPTNVEDVKALLKRILGKIISWLTSPSFLAQIGAVLIAYFLSPMIANSVKKRIPLFQSTPGPDAKLRIVREYIFQSGNFMRAIMLVGMLALFAVILKAVPMLGQDWLVKIAQGLAVVFLLFKAIKQFIPNPVFQKAAIWIVIPLALLMVFGYYDNLITWLNNKTLMEMGDKEITAMNFVRLAIFGAIFFKLGGISNSKGQTAIRSQETLDIATREVVAKLFQMLLFIILFVLILSFAGIPLSGLVMIFSAVGLGIGFGLQPIAANFVSGLIILFDRSVKVGDFVVLPDGQEGHVNAINMRSTIVETTDGKDIMVPNTKFTEESYENWTHTDPRQRYEVYFSVAYNTDVDALERILIPAVSKHPQVLQEPEEPDLELREFAASGINFAIEFWAEGIDDGENKFTSDLNYIVWRTLKQHNIEMPLPQRQVRVLK